MHPAVSRVVVVEDGQDDAYLFLHLLEKAGLRMTPQVFSSGDAALAAWRETTSDSESLALPAVIFIDIGLPGLGGFELLRWVRQQPALQQTAVIMLSGSDEPRDLGKAMKLGADAFAIKFPPPSGVRELLVALETFVMQPMPRPPLPVSCNLLAAVHSL